MADLTLNEIGAYCLGWKRFPPLGGFVWKTSDGGCADLAPDITLSDPPTDAQIGNVWRLREKAIELDNLSDFDKFLYERTVQHVASPDWIDRSPGSAFLEQIRDAAIDTLIGNCPQDVQEAWRDFQ